MCGEACKKLLSKTYEHAMVSAWTRGGCATSSPGCDNSGVKIQGLHRPFNSYDGDIEQAYIDDCFTGSSAFNYSDQLPGGDDQLGHDSDMETSSASEESSSDSDDKDEPSSPVF